MYFIHGHNSRLKFDNRTPDEKRKLRCRLSDTCKHEPGKQTYRSWQLFAQQYLNHFTKKKELRHGSAHSSFGVFSFHLVVNIFWCFVALNNRIQPDKKVRIWWYSEDFVLTTQDHAGHWSQTVAINRRSRRNFYERYSFCFAQTGRASIRRHGRELALLIEFLCAGSWRKQQTIGTCCSAPWWHDFIKGYLISASGIYNVHWRLGLDVHLDTTKHLSKNQRCLRKSTERWFFVPVFWLSGSYLWFFCLGSFGRRYKSRGYNV